MATIAAAEKMSFEQAPAETAAPLFAAEASPARLSHDQLILARSIALLELSYRNTRLIRNYKPRLIWKRMALVASIIERLYDRADNNGAAGSVDKLALKMAQRVRFSPLQLTVLYFTRTRPTECSQLLESVLLKMNAEITRLHPKSLSHFLQ